MKKQTLSFSLLFTGLLVVFLFLAVLMVPAAQAQEIGNSICKGITGPTFSLEGTELLGVYCYDGNHFYMVSKRTTRPRYFVSKFNESMELLDQKELKIVESAKGMSDLEINSFIEHNKELYVVTKKKDSKAKKINYFVEQVDLGTLSTTGKKNKIYEIDYSEDGISKQNAIFFIQSKDKNMLVVYDVYLAFKGENVTVHAKAMDKEFTTIWQKEVNIPVGDRTDNYRRTNGIIGGTNEFISPFEVSCIDSSANLYILAKVYNSSKLKDFDGGKLNFDYKICMIGGAVQAYRDVNFNLTRPIRYVDINSNKKGEIVAFATYADIAPNGKEKTKDQGIFLAMLDPFNQKLKAGNYNKFTDAALYAFQGKKYFAPYKTKAIFFEDNGGCRIVSEEYRYIETLDVSRGTKDKECAANNIMILNVNSSAKAEQVTVIPKSQHMLAYSGLCSFLAFYGEDNYDFFFYDHNDNIHGPSDKMKELDFSLKDASYVHVRVKPDGARTKEDVVIKYEEESKNPYLYLEDCGVINNHEVLFLAHDGRTVQKWVRFSLKDQ